MVDFIIRKGVEIEVNNYFEYIFSNDTNVELQILESIYNSTYGLDMDELITKVDLNRKTIHKHLDNINEVTGKYYDTGDSIAFQKRKYVFLGDRKHYYSLKCNMMKSEILVILIELFLSTKSVDLTLFCKNNFISESTLKRKLQKINILLESIGVRFVIRKNQIYILGEERIVRYCLISLLWRIYRGIEWPFKDVNEETIDNLISSIISSGRYINEGKRKHLAFYLAVFISRAQSGNSISKEFLPEYSEELINSSNYMEKLSKLIERDIPLPAVELDFLLLIFYIFPECYDKFHSIDTTLSILKKYSRRSYSSIMHFISFIKKKHPKWEETQPENPFFWPMLISGRIFVDIFKSAFFNSSAINIFKHATRDYPSLKPMIKKSILSHEPKLSGSTLKSLALRYGQAYVIEFSPHDFEPKINILLITDNAMYVDKIMAQRINNLLENRFNFTLSVTQPESTPDLIIGTDVIDTKYPNIERLFINSEVSKKDREKIITACSEILKSKMLKRVNKISK
ncbi:helix-turn-helix domain-containing protein [Lactococcus garvieae]|uniref:helix-turn-helix domain-containing protein n=1 Tax=Lactococcus garvieae TaxID=1363 RepID=UPI00288DE121|nr:helix-turn-helix domain-containing protein [Lactococcus garvieae]MDT2742371.1 helix-turn-helix domain-containing protein [Lactococcus garvieae]